MLEIDRNFYNFKRKDIWFNDRPFDVEGYHSVAFYSCPNKLDAPGFRRHDFTTLTIDLTQELDRIWKNIDRWSCRKKINKAYNHGVKVRVNEHIEDFYEINKVFRRDKGISASYMDVEFMKKYGTVLVAEVDGSIVCGQLFFADSDHIRGIIAGSRRLGVSAPEANVIGYANRLVIWEAIKLAKEKGIKEYDMGGYYTGREKNKEMEGINAFKAAFGGKLVTKYIYEKDYSRLYSAVKHAYDYGSAIIYGSIN